MKQNKNRLDIRYTVQPEEKISEEDWMQYVKAGRLVHKQEGIDRARDMNNQYKVEDNIHPLFKEIIKRWGM